MAAIGSSAADWNRLPLVTWVCVRASARLLLEDRADAGAVDGGSGEAHVISAPRSSSESNRLLRYADDLRRGLVGLLVAQHVGGFLVEVHARHAVSRGEIVFVDDRFGVAVHLRVARLQADVGRQAFDGAGHARACRRRARPPAARRRARRHCGCRRCAPALLRTVKVSPAAGVPVICTRQPLTSMSAPGV